MEIRDYAAGDAEAVVRLSLRAWEPVFASMRRAMLPAVYEAFYPGGDWRAAQSRAVAAAVADGNLRTWVAVAEGGGIAGFVAARLHPEDRMGEIYMIAVDPDFQRRGVSGALTDVAVRWMRESGMAIAMVETGGDPGHGPARASYEKSGFTLLPVARYFMEL